MFRTIGDPVSLWESRFPTEVLRLPEELARVDALLDDPVFFAPFAPYFHPVMGTTLMKLITGLAADGPVISRETTGSDATGAI